MQKQSGFNASVSVCFFPKPSLSANVPEGLKLSHAHITNRYIYNVSSTYRCFIKIPLRMKSSYYPNQTQRADFS